ncbi:hypothetical protein ACIHCM_21065 [Streptomyces sp. NPDC052023]|uniref:hypothetical protein n=1 Tax=Streptomyces sp. NPDC052023 TaxID=3365681 RepID=UPI0037D2C44D
MTTTGSSGGNHRFFRGEKMFEFEMHQARSAELIRRAERERQAREAVRLAHAARDEAAARTAESESHTHRPRRHRSPRVA